MLPYLYYKDEEGQPVRLPLLRCHCGCPIAPPVGATVFDRDGEGPFVVEELVYDYNDIEPHIRVWARRVK